MQLAAILYPMLQVMQILAVEAAQVAFILLVTHVFHRVPPRSMLLLIQVEVVAPAVITALANPV